MKNRNIMIVGIVILLVAISVAVYFMHNTGNTNKISSNAVSNEYPQGYDSDICRCVERERFRCLDGFVLNTEKRLCASTNGTFITNVILGCSAYDCGNTIYNFNFQDQVWEEATANNSSN